jgi:hypothetical protein
MICAFNIMNSSGNALNGIPILWDVETVSDFTKSIRENCLDIAKYGADSYSTISKMYLAVTIYEYIEEGYSENNFYISLKNVREFKQYIKMSHEDIKAEYEMKQRNKKIEDLGL